MGGRTRHDERDSSNSDNFQQRLHECAAFDEGTSAFAGSIQVCSLGSLHLDSHLLSRVTSDNVCLQMANLSNRKVERNACEFPYIARKQRINCEGASLSLVVCPKDNADIFYGHNQSERPNDEGECSKQIGTTWLAAEG